jgi:hypothetical protein
MLNRKNIKNGALLKPKRAKKAKKKVTSYEPRRKMHDLLRDDERYGLIGIKRHLKRKHYGNPDSNLH